MPMASRLEVRVEVRDCAKFVKPGITVFELILMKKYYNYNHYYN